MVMRPTPDFDPQAAAKKLLRQARTGALATLMAGSGNPYCSLVNVATLADGSPLLLLSRLAVHTKNLLADSRVSLMLDERTAGDPLEGARVMLMGRAGLSDDPGARGRYLARQPPAQMFVDFADFAFYRVTLEAIHLVAGFGRIVDLAPRHVLTNPIGAEALVGAEPDIVAHLNAAYAASLALCAKALLGAADDGWVCVGCDPEGLDLQLGRTALRLDFAARVTTPGGLCQELTRLAARARQPRS
jgi:putative heme iron utilization protein